MSRPANPNTPYCPYCGEATYHEYDPVFHAWICQTCFGGVIRSDKKDPFSVIRAEVNGLAGKIAKDGYSPPVKAKMKEIGEHLRALAERP